MTMTQNQKQGDSDRGAPASKASTRTSEEARDDASWIDPVCGMSVKRLSAFFTAEHGGTTYRFCSESCRADFEKDPERYTKAQRTAAED
ncbi:MAG TPA: YHS domain-containing protein [Polyangia bacterium]